MENTNAKREGLVPGLRAYSLLDLDWLYRFESKRQCQTAIDQLYFFLGLARHGYAVLDAIVQHRNSDVGRIDNDIGDTTVLGSNDVDLQLRRFVADDFERNNPACCQYWLYCGVVYFDCFFDLGLSEDDTADFFEHG